MTPNDEADPELAEIDELGRLERARVRSRRRVNHGSTALIVAAAASLLAIGAGALWVALRP